MVGVLEDGRTYATELVQSRKPGEGSVAQWEHELVCSVVHLAYASWAALIPPSFLFPFPIDKTTFTFVLCSLRMSRYVQVKSHLKLKVSIVSRA